MADPARKNPHGDDRVICHAYPLACAGVSAARLIPERCYLFEEIHTDPKGSEL